MTDPDYPQPIEFAAIRVGMHIHVTGLFPSGATLEVTDWVTAVADQAVTFATGLQGASPAAWAANGTVAYELVEPFSGDPNAPAVGAVLKTASGTIYQRQGNPRSDTWFPIGSTTPTTWAAITATGPVQILDGSNG